MQAIRRISRHPQRWVLALAGALAAGVALGAGDALSGLVAHPLDLSAAQQHWLYAMLVAWAAIFLAVLGAMLHSIIARRRFSDTTAPGPHDSTTAELVWTVVPLVIVVVTALLAFSTTGAWDDREASRGVAGAPAFPQRDGKGVHLGPTVAATLCDPLPAADRKSVV